MIRKRGRRWGIPFDRYVGEGWRGEGQMVPNRFRPAFTLVEVLVVIGIISILFGLLLPAVQSIRESARIVGCKNRLRQLGMASLNFESTADYLPGPWFNAPPDSIQYTSDRGFFVQLLPYVEQSNLDDQLRAAQTTFDIANIGILTEPIEMLNCPSASGEPVILNNIASRFSGPAIPGLSAVTCDYIGNGGYIPNSAMDPELTDGPIGPQIPGSGVPRETMARTSDGLSNTLLCWESIGGAVIPPNSGGLELPVNNSANTSFQLRLIGPPHAIYNSTGVAATKSYIHSWAGIRVGNMCEISGRVVNVGNKLGEPCSRHPSGANAVLLDHSIRMLSADLSPQVGFALASARGHDVASD